MFISIFAYSLPSHSRPQNVGFKGLGFLPAWLPVSHSIFSKLCFSPMPFGKHRRRGARDGAFCLSLLAVQSGKEKREQEKFPPFSKLHYKWKPIRDCQHSSLEEQADTWHKHEMACLGMGTRSPHTPAVPGTIYCIQLPRCWPAFSFCIMLNNC